MYGAADGLDILVALLSDTEQRIREEAAGALFVLLGQVGNVDIPVPAVNKLIEMLGNKEMAPDLRVNVARVLAQLMRDGNSQARQAMPAIMGLVTRAQEVKLVKGGVEALGLIGSADAVEPLKAAYADFLPPAAAPGTEGTVADKPQDTEVRLAVVYALVQDAVRRESGSRKCGAAGQSSG
jgi:HEAT repeat protein